MQCQHAEHGRVKTPETETAQEQIKQEWPVLMGADTLLAVQAMLRLGLRDGSVGSCGDRGSASQALGLGDGRVPHIPVYNRIRFVRTLSSQSKMP